MFDALSAMDVSPSVFSDWLSTRASEFPDRIAVIANGRMWTYAELDAEATRMARRLATLGVRSHDRIATLLHNGAAAAVIPHAALRLGATIVPLNVRLSESEVAWQLRDCAPRLLVGESRTLEGMRTATTDILSVSVDAEEAQLVSSSLGDIEEADVPLRLKHDADSVLAIIYTSGTTGRPKGAMLTVANFWWSAAGSALNLGTENNDRWLACLPLFHVGGLSIVIRSAIYGITAVIHDGFDPEAVNAAIDNEGITIVSVVAVMLERMLDAREAEKPFPPTLRVALVGGGPAPRALLERAIASGIPVAQTYGLTEACSQVATLPPDDGARKLGSAGRALRPNELRIAPSDGREAGSNDDGEILVKGPIVMAGYFGQPDATSSVIVDEWLHTGDAGRLDDDGYLFVLDRRDDLIVTGGENVYPAEVEAVLSSHPAVVEAAVIGVDDPQWGQRVIAIARLDLSRSSAPDVSALQAFCRKNLAGYKVPREIRFVNDPLPRTASGKLRRAALRESRTS